MVTLKNPINLPNLGQDQKTPAIKTGEVFNQDGIDKLDAINFDGVKPELMLTTINGKRAFKVAVEKNGCKYYFDVFVNQEIVEYVYLLVNARFPDKPELTGDEDYDAEIGEDFGFTLFKLEIENKSRIIFKEDFITSRGERCMKADIWHTRGVIKFCIKRTPELEQFLADKGLVLTRAFNKEQES